MTNRLILIAHAETSATRRGTFPFGESLDPRGRIAAAKLAPRFADTLTTEALTSPAPAARETAEALGLEATVEAALADIDVGEWSGRSIMDVGTNDPEAAAAWIADSTFAGHGGESFDGLIKRVAAWLSARLEAKGTTIAISHAAVLRGAAIAALGAQGPAFWRIEAAPLSMLSLGSDGRRWVLRELRQS